MIKRIEHEYELDRELLLKTLDGRKMLAYMKAYGPDYEFCRFFKLTDQNGIGFMFIINSTLIICADDKLSASEEIDLFVSMNVPFRIEGCQRILRSIKLPQRYQALNRTVFQLVPSENRDELEKSVNFSPKLTEVYDILSEGFPNIAEFSLWYTDTSHRCRHGMSKVLTYKDSTSASIAYDVDDVVLVSQVATRVSSRGKGYAREFLGWLAGFLTDAGKTAFLYALDVRVGFYREIGFKEVAHEIVLERIDVEKESTAKGRLTDEQQDQ